MYRGMMIKRLFRIVLAVVIFGVGGLAAFTVGDLVVSMNQPELKPWHTIKLGGEFRTGMEAGMDWESYLVLEQELFDELASHKQTIESAIQLRSSRYIDGGNRFQRRVASDWNRSYRLDAVNPSGVALLVHGLSDSPYALKNIAQQFNAAGFIVYGLRLPGHGTLPSSLDDIVWQDWLAAVWIADRHIREQHGDLPYVFAGYSTGAALGVKLALDAMAAGTLAPDRMLLFSPALGVSPLARFANLHRVISHLDAFEKARWLEVLPEYDPYKYNSFTKNAGKQVSLLVNQVYSDIDELRRAGSSTQLPPITSFQSLVDATVSTLDLIDKLYAAIDNDASELVLFDVNQLSYFKELIRYDPAAIIDALSSDASGHFRLTLVTNRDDASPSVIERSWHPGSDQASDEPLALAWPEDIYSLSHTSITFPPDDPVYGYAVRDDRGSEVLTLGNLSIRGEQGVLTMPAAKLLRLRSNPFYPYIEQRVAEIIQQLVAAPAKRVSSD